MPAAGGPEAERCFGWSARAWARPWRQALADLPAQRFGDALEVGAGPHSSLAPLLLALADRVECSAFDERTLPAIAARNALQVAAHGAQRIRYSRQDVRALEGQWDLIVLKSVLGGVYRVHDSTLADVHGRVHTLVRQHLRPGGVMITLDNGRTALEPLFARLGARRNGWRFFRLGELPTAERSRHFGVLSAFSAATRLGALGRRIDDALYVADVLLTPLARQHAVHVHVYRRPS